MAKICCEDFVALLPETVHFFRVRIHGFENAVQGQGGIMFLWLSRLKQLCAECRWSAVQCAAVGFPSFLHCLSCCPLIPARILTLTAELCVASPCRHLLLFSSFGACALRSIYWYVQLLFSRLALRSWCPFLLIGDEYVCIQSSGHETMSSFRTIVHTILFLKACVGGGLIILLNTVSSWNCFPV